MGKKSDIKRYAQLMKMCDEGPAACIFNADEINTLETKYDDEIDNWLDSNVGNVDDIRPPLRPQIYYEKFYGEEVGESGQSGYFSGLDAWAKKRVDDAFNE